MDLNLETKTKEQQLIKQYLKENASPELAEKINHGVKIEKEGKTFINRKDLNGFMKFACEEAKKLAEKGASSTYIEDKVVYGWAIHYFEENSIEGTLYNEDGSPYKEEKKITTQVIKQPTPPSAPKNKSQISIFDIYKTQSDPPATTIETTIEGDLIVNKETGEIINEDNQNIDEGLTAPAGKNSEVLAELYLEFGDEITIK